MRRSSAAGDDESTFVQHIQDGGDGGEPAVPDVTDHGVVRLEHCRVAPVRCHADINPRPEMEVPLSVGRY